MCPLQRRMLWQLSSVASHRLALTQCAPSARNCCCFSLRCFSTVGCGAACATNTSGSGSDNTNKRAGDAISIPSIIFFGGDIVSLVALKMLHERLEKIKAVIGVEMPPSEEQQCIPSTPARPQLVVVCPFLPGDPKAVSQRHRRQYPVARYCVEQGIPLLPVDHPTSLAQSGTLRYLLHPWHSSLEEGGGSAREEGGYIAGQPLEAFDVAVVVSFRYFLPNRLLERLPRTVNIHPSLLPRYRGASPIFAPLLRCDEAGGASIIKMAARQKLMDSGDVLWRQSVPIPRDMSVREYFPLVTRLAAAGLCECLFGGPPALSPTTDWHAVDIAADAVTDAAACSVCDWPRSFDARWSAAWPQNYNVHFRDDPYHASRLPKDRAVLHWDAMTAEEAYGTWRAFVGGEYFSPTVNAILDKGATPVREQLLKRLLLGAARKIKKSICDHQNPHEGTPLSSSSSSPPPSSSSAVVGEGNCGGLSSPPSTSATSGTATTEEMSVEADDHHHLHRHLLIPCTFTDAVHPRDVPSAVWQELRQLEKGDDSATILAVHQHHYDDHDVESHISPGSAYFPKAVEDMCAVKCRAGWFVWQKATLKGSTSQPAYLLRKGMAMKTGVLYVGLFVENNEGE
ncbi:methionyl-tRNA formyltransferase [Trypanosoma grayi]|uniref:methionyl-tRNA formyltransferase n=1 Tax=Trypanosoma grayi TaxID=71804 RepID=UPI0004F45886|nr:methionyl-tRNA formyltransferase [Trypanosoma grayi]KEG14325.1 methionyl-tRNA formyltransferase [Trypanosoma grayi]